MSYGVFVGLCLAGLMVSYMLAGLLLRWFVTSMLNHFVDRRASAKGRTDPTS
jgi:hypothetical protein